MPDEKNTANEEMKRSEEKYRLLAERSNALVFEVNEKGEFIYINNAFTKIMGYEPEELLGRSAFDLGDPEEREKAARVFEKAQTINYIQNSIWKLMDKNKQYHYLSCDSHTYAGSDGRIRINVVSFDITEHIMAEKRLLESEEKYRLLVENAPIAIFISAKGKILYLNNEAIRLFGAESAELLLGTNIIDRIHPDYRDIVRERITITDDDRKIVPNIEEKYIRMNGEVLDVEVLAAPFFFENENASIVFVHDITRRKTAERALRESEKKYRETLELLPLGVFELDTSGNIAYVNSKLLEYSGYTKDDLVNDLINVREMIDPPDLPRVMENIKKLYSGEITVTNNEYTGVRKDGKKYPVQVMSMLAKSEDRITGVRGILIDIADKKSLENEIQKSRAFESLGILAGGIAHDFNNILTGIRAYISLVKYLINPLSQDELVQYLIEADKAIIRAESLTKQLLTFSKGGTPVKKLSFIGDIITESADFVTRGSRSKCYYSFGQGLWMAEIDGEQISQVIQNMAINASQSMPHGGRIEISASNYDNSVYMNPLLAAGGKYIRIAIKDYGHGIPENNLKNIFDPYFSTKKTGSGLGLSISHSIINRHDGIIEVESELNAGTTFSIYLPATPEKAIKTIVTDTASHKLEKVKKVLFMDDDEYIRESAKAIFDSLNIICDFAVNGAEAVEFYDETKKRGGTYDALILDLTIPNGMGGKETIEKLLEIDPNVKAIVSSGYSNDQVMSNYKQYGFKAILTKPFDINSLVDAIINAAGSE